MENRSQTPEKRNFVVAYVLTAAVAALAIGVTWALRVNVLEKYPAWQSGKIGIAMELMGSVAFIKEPQALAGNKLNLGAFFGYQEVTRTTAEDLAAFKVSFKIDAGGYINILYDIDEEGFSGVRLSSNPEFPNIQFRGLKTGEFVRTRTLKLVTPPEANVWHVAEMKFLGTEMELQVDGRTRSVFLRRPGLQRIGFRGGQQNAWVDNIVLTYKDGTIIRESFANWTESRNAAGVTFIALLIFGGLIAFASRSSRRKSVQKLAFQLLTLNIVLTTIACIFYPYQYFTAAFYWKPPTDVTEEDAKYIRRKVDFMLQNLSDRYGSQGRSGTDRVLFIGSSQTWGSGADHISLTWVHQLQKLVNDRGDTHAIELLNGAAMGLTSHDILELVREHFLSFHPQKAVITLSNNDLDAEAFRANLSEIVRLLKDRNIEILFLLEANSIEERDGPYDLENLYRNHEVVRLVASQNKAKVIDANQYLLDQRDKGFLWWDFVHLTSFGQRLLAEQVYQHL